MNTFAGKSILTIDAHTHVFEKVKGFRFGGVPVMPLCAGKVKVGDEIIEFADPAFNDLSSRIEVYMAHMEKNGIDKAVLLQTPCYGPQYDYIDEIRKRNPHKFQTVGLADPRDKEKYITAVKHVVRERGYFGIKFEIPDTPFDMDAKEYEYVWETIIDNDTFIIIDLGWNNGPYDFLIDKMTTVVKRYPDMKIVLPHLGVSHFWDPNERPDYPGLRKTLALVQYSKENLWFDVAGIPMLMRKFAEYPYPQALEILRLVQKTIGLNHVMWGTDYPCVTEPCTYRQALTMYLNYCDFLSGDEVAKFFGETADALYFSGK
jgi:predicted TIM-barrel fold metal-dependent hydrolase